MMTHRERFRAVLRGEKPDRVPVVSRLDIWHKTRQLQRDLPREWQDKSLDQLQLGLSMGLSARAAKVFRMTHCDPVQHVEWREGQRLFEEWRTPKGTLRMVREHKEDDEARGIRPMIVEHPIRSLDDYAIYEEVMRHRVYEPDYETYHAYDRLIGENGLPVVVLQTFPVHELMLSWVGYENACDHMINSPEVFDHAVETANEVHRQMWDVVAKSPCEFVLHGAHFDSAMTPPPMFKKYFLPYARAFNEHMHKAGKRTAFHGDADLSRLLDLILETGFDVVDCFAVDPLVPCTFREARQRWGNRMVIWGGVPSILLESPYTERQLQEHLEMLLHEAGVGTHFICGISDQAMPGSALERIKQIASFFASHRLAS